MNVKSINLIEVETINIHIPGRSYGSIEELDAESGALMNAAIEAMGSAYAPYSNFMVGAAVLLENDVIVRGSNQENAAYPSGLCAERVAVFAAASAYPGKAIRKIAIAARRRDSVELSQAGPCGACRQVLTEYEDHQKSMLQVLMHYNGRILVLDSAGSLLPFKFGADSL